VTSVIAGDVRNAARALDVVLVGLNLSLVAWLTARMTANRSVVVATIPPILLLFDSDVGPGFTRFLRIPRIPLFGWVQLHRSVASEPLFMALFMVGLLALHRVLTEMPHRTRRLMVAAVAVAAAAPLVRYVGVALIMTAVIAILAMDRRGIRSRVRRAAIFASVALAPTVLFILWPRLVGTTHRTIRTDTTGNQAHKTFNFESGTVRTAFHQLADYMLPRGGSPAARVVVVLVVIGLLIVGALWGRLALPGASAEQDRDARSLLQLVLLGLASYVLVVMATITFIDFGVSIDWRMFAPIRGLWYAVLVAVAYRFGVRVMSRAGAAVVVSALAAVLVVCNWSNTRRALDAAPARPPTRTAVSDAIAHLPRNAILFSNAPDAIYDLTGRASVALPTYFANAPTRRYESDLEQVIEILREHGGYVALDSPPYNYVPIPPELERSLKLQLIAQTAERPPDASLYETRPG
jgi:hypothetical protein